MLERLEIPFNCRRKAHQASRETGVYGSTPEDQSYCGLHDVLLKGVRQKAPWSNTAGW